MPSHPTSARSGKLRVHPIEGQNARWAARSHGQWLVLGWSTILTVLMLAPLLPPGYLLIRDGVSTPRSYFTDSALGLGELAPRAVPQDWFFALLTPVINGGILTKIILFGSLIAAGTGYAHMARSFLPTIKTTGAIVAATVAIWNPYVTERLLQGHWSLMTAYAALGPIICCCSRLRRQLAPRQWLRQAALLACLFAFAGLTPTGALLAIIVAAVALFAPAGISSGWSRFSILTAVTALTIAPWGIAAVISHNGAASTDPSSVHAFAARAEPGLGTLGSLIGLGGIWNASAVPLLRNSYGALLATLTFTLVIAVGAVFLMLNARRQRIGSSTFVAYGLTGLAIVAISGPALAATGWGLAVFEQALVHLPGAGLFRDTQKYVALAMPIYALCAGASVLALRKWVLPHLTMLFAIILVVFPSMDAAWGVGGRIESIHYPPDWAVVARLTTAGHGVVAVMPKGMIRLYTYAHGNPVLDPAPRFLRADVLQTGELPVGGRIIDPDSGRAQLAQTVLSRGDPQALAQLGIGWVLIEKSADESINKQNELVMQGLTGVTVVYSGKQLTLYKLDYPSNIPVASVLSRSVMWTAHLLWFGEGVVGLAAYVYLTVMRRRSAPRIGSRNRIT